jgi:hypothetical protein
MGFEGLGGLQKAPGLGGSVLGEGKNRKRKGAETRRGWGRMAFGGVSGLQKALWLCVEGERESSRQRGEGEGEAVSEIGDDEAGRGG